LLHLNEDELRRQLGEDKRKLFAVRSQRVWPGRDEKVLTAWNGLTIDAFARAAQAFDQPALAHIAGKAADFLLQRMRTSNGRLLRTYMTGSDPKLNGYLEDYSFLVEALVSLYEATFEPKWIQEAGAVADVMIEQFWDSTNGGFFYTGKDHEQLLTRSKDPQDNAIPSGNSMAATALLRLAKLTGRADFLDKAEKTLGLFRGLMAEHPMAAGQMLIALDFYLGPVQEFAVAGDPNDAETRRVLAAIRSGFRPNKVVALGRGRQEEAKFVPLLADRPAKGTVTTYICQNLTCEAPLIGAEAVVAKLGK